VIVELFGPSGSGKSYLASRLAVEYEISLVRVSFGQKHLLALLFALGHPRLSFRLLSLWHRRTRETRTLRRKKLYRLVSFLAKEQKARLMGGGVVDEGIFQFFLILHEEKISPPEIAHCLAPLARADYLVCIVESGPATRLARMQARGEVSRWELGDDYVKRWQQTLETNAAELKAILSADFRCLVRRND
jgi:hypothetical protein